jgi:hypothetical protein
MGSGLPSVPTPTEASLRRGQARDLRRVGWSTTRRSSLTSELVGQLGIGVQLQCGHCIGPGTNEVGINLEADANFERLAAVWFVHESLGELAMAAGHHLRQCFLDSTEPFPSLGVRFHQRPIFGTGTDDFAFRGVLIDTTLTKPRLNPFDFTGHGRLGLLQPFDIGASRRDDRGSIGDRIGVRPLVVHPLHRARIWPDMLQEFGLHPLHEFALERAAIDPGEPVGPRMRADVARAAGEQSLGERARRAAPPSAAADELDARRAGLDALGLQVTQMQRTGSAARLPWPPEIRTALTPELRGPPRLPIRVATPAGTDMVAHWATIAAHLADDAEAEIELSP